MKLIDLFEDTRPYLHWNIVARMNTRSVAYARKDMIRSLEKAGCVINEVSDGPYGDAPDRIKSQVLDVKRYVEDGEDPREVRKEVDRAIRIIHPKAPRKFLGFIE